MSDCLRMDYINSLPQPFLVRFYGGKHWWEVYDIGVDVPIVRINVAGKLEVHHFSDVAQIRDLEGSEHNPDDWYVEARHE